MYTLNENKPAENNEINKFTNQINFLLPKGFIDFYFMSNGCEIIGNEDYYVLWDINDMIDLNNDYEINDYAPNFFIFGSNGGDDALVIEKNTGHIFKMPFIGMSNNSAEYISETFGEFMNNIK